MLGVVNVVVPVPPESTVPPLATEYQSTVSPAPTLALKATVPVPQRAALVPVGTDGRGLTVVVMELDVAGEPSTQVAFEFMTTLTTSPDANAVVV